jgi:hypothetical protein
MMKAPILTSLVLLLILELSLSNPPEQVINVEEEPINEEVIITINPWEGDTVRVTYHCEAFRDGNSTYLEWFLIKGNMEIASSEDKPRDAPCDEEWHLEEGEYVLKSYKTDNIRYDQSVEFHILEPMTVDLRLTCVLIGIIVWLFKSRLQELSKQQH